VFYVIVHSCRNEDADEHDERGQLTSIRVRPPPYSTKSEQLEFPERSLGRKRHGYGAAGSSEKTRLLSLPASDSPVIR
jgi:hypothetical protein